MASLFSFRGEVEWDSRRGDVIFTYIPGYQLVASDIERNLVDSLSDGKISPDWLVYVAPIKEKEQLSKMLESPLLSERFENLKRCQWVGLALFEKTGIFSEVLWVKCNDPTFGKPNPDIILTSVRNAGLGCLASRDGVITQAPPGAYFRNPSQSPRSYFIRAALLCRNSVEASFIAFTLLPLVAKARELYCSAPNIIWVDTVSIAYIAYALSELGGRLEAFASPPEIRSYSSYKGLADTTPNSGEYPLFIISASTSGKMAKDLESCSGGRIKLDTVGTILGVFDAEFPQLLYSIPESQRGRKVESVDTLREILVSGEDFLFNPGEPIAVVLKRLQLPKNFSESFEKIQGAGLIHYFKRFSGYKAPKAFLIDGSALAVEPAFREWLVRKAIGTLPASVRRIVYQDDEGSKQMAQLVRDAIAPFRGEYAPEVLSIEDIEQRSPEPDETVAVMAAVAGSGMALMRITKALRRYQPNGSRFFLIGAVLARSYAQLEHFKSNLRLADKNLTFAIETWCEYAPAASAIHEYKKREMDFLINISESMEDHNLADFAKTRLEALQAEGVVHKGVPKGEPFISLSGRADAFNLSKGFALWKDFDDAKCHIDVLFTVTCWLQNARECPALPNSERLDGGGFQQAIIAPDCFLRFTDPVIQASILRCAHDSELDYRSSVMASARAAEIISKFIRLREESVVEFLMALALNRMRLRQQDHIRVIEEAKQLALTCKCLLIQPLISKYENDFEFFSCKPE